MSGRTRLSCCTSETAGLAELEGLAAVPFRDDFKSTNPVAREKPAGETATTVY
jgi:hypothetical protein